MTRTLFLGRGPAWSSGCAQYTIEREEGAFPLIVAARCRLGRQRTVEWAMVDTGAQWSVIGGEIAAGLDGDFFDAGKEIAMSTRLGRFSGRFQRLDVTLEADEGEALLVSATVAVLPSWPGPVVLGYRGFWERVRLGLDPGSGSGTQWMFFGAAE
jgi:hypothetical protein